MGTHFDKNQVITQDSKLMNVKNMNSYSNDFKYNQPARWLSVTYRPGCIRLKLVNNGKI